MSKEKFTAGPWIKGDNGTVVNRQGFIIAQTTSINDGSVLTPEERQANQQLISATTDMYNFIKDLYVQAQNNQAHYPALEAVYNKALGINP